MNSNTASNLMGLLSQWQSIETSLTNYMIETVMKLSSLTESSVFILVETTEGRRFAGKHHLVSLYNSGCLHNDGTDIELEADVHSSTLRPKPMPSTQAQEPCYSQFAAPSLLPARDRKRPNSSSEQNESPKKRRASVDVVDDIVISDDEDGEPSAIKSELDLAEMNPRSIKLDPMTIPLSPTIDSTDYSTQHHVISPSFIRAIDRAIDQDTNTEFDLSWVTNEFIAGSKKAHVIVNAEGAEAFTDVTKKILDSLLYDLGKAAAVKYLPESGSNTPVTKLQTKRYIDSLFDVWCANFAHMPSLEKLELNFTSEKKMSFKIYMRARISNAFSSVRRIKSKQSQR